VAVALISEPSSPPSRDRPRPEEGQRIRLASQWHKSFRPSRILGEPIRPVLRSSSNLDGEIPMYIAASTRDRPRLGVGRCGTSRCRLPILSVLPPATGLELDLLVLSPAFDAHCDVVASSTSILRTFTGKSLLVRSRLAIWSELDQDHTFATELPQGESVLMLEASGDSGDLAGLRLWIPLLGKPLQHPRTQPLKRRAT
jgi:hypothetical protein